MKKKLQFISIIKECMNITMNVFIGGRATKRLSKHAVTSIVSLLHSTFLSVESFY